MRKKTKTLAMGEQEIRRYLINERRRKDKQPEPTQKKSRLKRKKPKRPKRVSRLGFFATGKVTVLSSAFETNRRRH